MNSSPLFITMACQEGYEGFVRKTDWGGFIETESELVEESPSEVPPHYFHGGPASGSEPAIPTFRPLNDDDLAVAAILDKPNVFTDVNTFPGLRVGPKTVTTDYTLTDIDCELLVDATDNPVNITLPFALGDGQFFRIKKIDGTANFVAIGPQTGDFIDGQLGVTLLSQYDDCSVIDADTGYWDKLPQNTEVVLGDVARLSQINPFTNLNIFTGIRLSTQTVAGDYNLTTLDFEVLVDASAAAVTITLPASEGNGQYYRVKKIDDTANIVTITAVGSDLIDGSISTNLVDQYSDCSLLDADLGYWDNIGGTSDSIDNPFYISENARFLALTSPNGVAFELFDGASWLEQWRFVV